MIIAYEYVTKVGLDHLCTTSDRWPKGQHASSADCVRFWSVGAAQCSLSSLYCCTDSTDVTV
jgi:hypothetical protein